MCLKLLVDEGVYSASGVAIGDMFVFIFSLFATIKHFTESGGHFTDVTYFHIIHASYCLSFGAYRYLMLDIVKCQCDPLNIIFVIYVSLYVLSWERFLRHWKKVKDNIEILIQPIVNKLFFSFFLVLFFYM